MHTHRMGEQGWIAAIRSHHQPRNAVARIWRRAAERRRLREWPRSVAPQFDLCSVRHRHGLLHSVRKSCPSAVRCPFNSPGRGTPICKAVAPPGAFLDSHEKLAHSARRVASAMEFEWDPTKHVRNLRTRGIGLDEAALISEGEVIEMAGYSHRLWRDPDARDRRGERQGSPRSVHDAR